MKKILAAVAIVLVAGSVLPCAAETKPDDLIGVVIVNEYLHLMGTPQQKPGHAENYFKKWKDLKLDAKNKAGLIKEVQKLDRRGAEMKEKYRLGFIMIYDGNLLRASFYSNLGSVVMMNWPPGSDPREYACAMTFSGNGGFTGIKGKPCYAKNY